MGQPNGNGYAMNGKNGNGNADHSIHDIEMENTSDRDALLMEERRANEQPINEKPAPPKEEPASRQMVIFSILFYLVAAIVVSWSPFPSQAAPVGPGLVERLLC